MKTDVDFATKCNLNTNTTKRQFIIQLLYLTLTFVMFSLAPMASASGIRLSRFDKQATKQSSASRKTRLPAPDDDTSKSFAILPHHVIRSLLINSK